MKDEEKTKEQFINELLELRQRIAELEKSEIKRKEVEKALQHSEERFRQVAESSGEFIWEVDINGLYTYANPVVEEILGYKPDELIGKKHFYNFFHPDVMDTLKKAAFEVIAKKEVFRNFVNPNVHKNGNTVILETSGSPVIDDKGTLLGYRGSDRNVTERKKAEDTLRESEEKYRTVSDFTYDWEYWIDPSDKYIYVSPSCERITGYRAEELLANPDLLDEIIHPDYLGLVKNHMSEILSNSGDVNHIDFRIIRRSGENRWISHCCQPVFSNDGRFLGRRGSNRDITARKQIEEALKKSEERYKKLVKAVTAYTYSVQVSEGRATSTNHSSGCIPITGYNPEDYKSDPFLWHSMIHPDDRMMAEDSVKEILVGHKIPPIEHRIIRSDGKVVWVRNTMVPYYALNGLLIRYDGLIEDVTERKLAEEKIQKLNEQLEQKVLELMEANKELEAFNRSVSHDLQTPLIIIGGFAKRLLKFCGDKLDTDEIDMINAIQMSAQKMERFIKDLLLFSRSGRQEIKPVKIDMRNLMTTVIDELKTLTNGRMIKFDIKAFPPAYGDMGLMKQVLVNLLSNAIKFTHSKDMAVIEVGCRVEENENIYYVKDNGIGFYSEYTDKLFTPFYRLPDAKEFEGTGVGLSIVERIIHRHGGRVWAEGKVNEGATFFFSLPNKV